MNYTYDIKGKRYVSDNSQKIAQRLINISKVLTKKHIEHTSIQDAIKSSETLAQNIIGELRENDEIKSLGIEVMGFSVLAILPNKETARALEAQAREEILRKADEALYERRNASFNSGTEATVQIAEKRDYWLFKIFLYKQISNFPLFTNTDKIERSVMFRNV